MPTLEVAELSVKPGEKVKGYLGHVTMGNGSAAGIPVLIANGVDDGPTLLVLASVHGTEVVGVGATIEAMRTIDARNLRGRVIAVTAANPLALTDSAYDTPYDHINLGTPLFKDPKPAGLLTERIAAVVMKAAQTATNMIDMHANPEPAIPFVLYNPALCKDEQTKRETIRLARAFGVTVIESGGDPAAAQRDVRHGMGLTTMTPELTGNMFLREEAVEIGKTGILNVMKALGMVDGAPEPQHGKKLEGDFVFHGRVVANAGGLLWVRKQPGMLIRRGEVVAEIQDLWGDTVDQVRMPVDGYCWAFGGRPGTSHVVAEGTAVNYVFKERERAS